MALSSPDSLHSVLEAFKPVLKSIDVRTVAVKESSTSDWVNLLTSIIISGKTADEVKAEYAKLPDVRNNEFAIFLEAVPFNYEVFKQITSGSITFHILERGRSVKVKVREFNPLSLKVSSLYRKVKGTYVRALYARASPQGQQGSDKLWKIFNSQSLEAKRVNYSNVTELAQDMLGIEDIGSGSSKDIEIAILSDIKIKSAFFDNSAFKVKLSHTTGVKDLQLNFVLERANNFDQYGSIWRTIYLLKEDVQQAGSSNAEIIIKPPELLPFDRMSVELIHRESGLSLESASAIAPLQNVIEPFLKAFSDFCNFEEFRRMLFEPVHYGKQPQKIFENAVTWLLSLAGFHTINLGFEITLSKGTKKFDSLVAEASGAPIGSTDILAYEDNKQLLLVDCDIGGVDDNKIYKLLGVRKHFEASNMSKQLSLVPVICTPKECAVKTNRGVAIVDRPVLEAVFEEIAKGNSQAARDKIIEMGCCRTM